MKDIFLSAKEVNKLKETNQNIIIFDSHQITKKPQEKIYNILKLILKVYFLMRVFLKFLTLKKLKNLF